MLGPVHPYLVSGLKDLSTAAGVIGWFLASPSLCQRPRLAAFAPSTAALTDGGDSPAWALHLPPAPVEDRTPCA